ncbi:hypothetical protein Trydic_g8658, partial [Trypoxylus dichotomus]
MFEPSSVVKPLYSREPENGRAVSNNTR